jgi:serine/threonine-protein kinase
VKAGDIVADKYRVENVLGAGAMGMVVAATHLTLERRVALKFMLSRDGGSDFPREQEERFLREARVASKLQSQHAAKVLDVGVLFNGAPYIVMEFLDGKDLAAVLAERGPFSVEEAVTYVLQVCEAVAEAHAAGIVHRDIKPANLFLTKGADGSPCVKLTDFGVAKAGDAGALGLTGTVQALGSPLYMSPEQMNASKDVDARSDIWALGVVLYELLAKITPFQAPTLTALCTRVYFRDPDPIEQYRQDVPPGLTAVIMQCFEKGPDRRWPNVAAFAAALAPYGSADSVSYAGRVARVQRADVAPSRPTDLLPPEPKPVRGEEPEIMPAIAVNAALSEQRAPASRAGWLVFVGMVLVLGIGLAVFYSSSSHEKTLAQPVVASASAVVSSVPAPVVSVGTQAALPAHVEPPPTAAPASTATVVKAPVAGRPAWDTSRR